VIKSLEIEHSKTMITVASASTGDAYVVGVAKPSSKAWPVVAERKMAMPQTTCTVEWQPCAKSAPFHRLTAVIQQWTSLWFRIS